MKTIIFGARGMLGADLAKVFSDWDIVLLDKKEIDITSKKAVFDTISKVKPDLVINAAAYTDVDGCEVNKELAMRVNAEAPGYLARASKDVGAALVCYSTDYVFHGDKKEGYKEDDAPQDPLNVYGESKLQGEINIQKVGGAYYILRTSWLFGLGGSNFVETILEKIQNIGGLTPDILKVVNDQHGKPTFSLDLARRTRELLEGNYAPGIYHITNEPAATWYEFAKEILKEKSSRENFQIFPCSSGKFPRPAQRPKYSVLLNTKLPLSRGWREGLGEYMQKRNS